MLFTSKSLGFSDFTQKKKLLQKNGWGSWFPVPVSAVSTALMVQRVNAPYHISPKRMG